MIWEKTIKEEWTNKKYSIALNTYLSYECRVVGDVSMNPFRDDGDGLFGDDAIF